MKCIVALICIFWGSIAFGYGQNASWASKVIDFSSEMNLKESSAQQILGKPNKYPKTERTTCAWSPQFSDIREQEFIQVSFSSPIVAQQILIVENFNAGHIQSVSIKDDAGVEKQVYLRTNASISTAGRLFTIAIKGNGLKVRSVKLVMDKQDRNNPYQIDAIGLSATSEPVVLKINELDIDFKGASEDLGPAINTASDEVYPVIAPDGNAIYFDRKYYPGNTGIAKEDDIWYSKKNNGPGSEWMTSMPLAVLNNDGSNFLCSISPDGNSIIVGGNFPGADETTRIFLVKKTTDGWGKPIPVKINNYRNNSFINEFSLAADGSTMIMSAQTNDGYGLLDLFISSLLPDGSYSTPINLGATINTAGQEMTPFLAADGKTLYFSSNGFPGYGFQDIYMSRRTGSGWTEWSEPLNLGNKVNSAEWEAYYTIDAKGEYAYYSTSKATGSNLDIYRIKLPAEARPEDIVWLKGIVRDKTTGEIINAEIEYTSQSDSNFYGISSALAPTGYALVLPQSDVYRVKITSDKYYVTDTVIEIKILEGFKEIIRDFTLIPKVAGTIIEMNNILFKVNSAVLEDTSFTELDKVVRFLKQNPDLEIEIRGHTNNVCDENYCNQLSGKRAKTVMDYFISKGIAPSRLSSKGLGKSVPIADNSTAAGRQKNQRVEFMITKTE